MMYVAPRSTLLCIAFLVLWSMPCALADPSSEPALTMEELLQKSKAAFDRRAELLKHSMGTAHVKVTRSGGEKMIARLADQYRSLGIDPSTMGTAGGNSMTVHWYTKGDNLRYDLDIRPLDGISPWTPDAMLRIATNGKVGVYYVPLDQKAYINQPPTRTADLTNYMKYFDPVFPYSPQNVPAHQGLIERAKRERATVEYANLDGLRCVHFSWPPKAVGVGKLTVIVTQQWFSIEQGYSLVRNHGTCNLYDNNVLTQEMVKTYAANYTPSLEFPDVWILKSMSQHVDGDEVEDLSIDFEEVHLGVDVPDVTFNYDGLGVPTGTAIYDRRAPGDTPVYHYHPGVYVGLDRIDLAAGTMPREESKGANCPGTESDG